MSSITPHGAEFRAQVKYKGVRKSAVFPTRRLAINWAARVEQQIEEGLFNAKDTHTFSDLCDKYLDISADKRGAKWEARRIEAMRQHFGAIDLADIQAPQIAAWRDKRLETVSGSTVHREVNVLRRMFKVAKNEWHWMAHEPFQGVKLPTQNPPRHQTWGWRQIRLVLREGRRRGYKTLEVTQAFHIALRTAMRLKEVLVAPEAYSNRVVTLTPDQTKPGRREHVPIGRIAAKLLDRPPFTVGPNEASTLFRRLTRQLLIDDLTFHDSRATALTLLARKVDVMTLAKISRHKDIRILQNTYFRESPHDIAKRI